MKCPYCIEGLDFDNYCLKKSCLQSDDVKFTLKRNHPYYSQVQQQLHIVKKAYCDFVVFAVSKAGSKFIHERILPDSEHWASQVSKLSLFWRICILPEVLGRRWYTRKMDLKKELGTYSSDGDCYCRRTSEEPQVTCSNPDCPISKFHLACLCIESVPKTWLCPHCRKLPSFIRSKKAAKKSEKAIKGCTFVDEALSKETICICEKKACAGEKILKCHNEWEVFWPFYKWG